MAPTVINQNPNPRLNKPLYANGKPPAPNLNGQFSDVEISSERPENSFKSAQNSMELKAGAPVLNQRSTLVLRKYNLNVVSLTTPRLLDTCLTEDTKSELNKLKTENPKRYKTVISVIKNSYCDNISKETLNEFVAAVMDERLEKLLDFALGCDVEFEIMKFPSSAQYMEFCDKEGKISRRIQLFQFPSKNGQLTTIDSLPHELTHAFDRNAKPSDFGFEVLRVPNIREEEGKLIKDSACFLPNTTKFGKKAFLEFISFTKEFEEAFRKDYERMLEIDRKKGLYEGETFKSLYDDKNISYYFGAISKKSAGFREDVLRKELFAQLGAYSVMGKTTKPAFDEVIRNYFPNCLEFTKSVVPH